MSFLRRAVSALPVSLISIIMIGCGDCDDRAMQLGEHGNLKFYYEPADLHTEFDRPLATGSELTIYALDLDKNPVHKLTDIKSTNPNTLTAVPNNRAHNAIQIIGEREGTATVSVQAQTGKGQTHDQFSIEVADPRQISLRHTCTDNSNAAYPVGKEVFLDFKRLKGGQKLVGESKSCSVRVEPDEIQPSTRCDESFFKLPAFDSVGSVRLSSQVNNPRGSRDELGVQIVNPTIIDFLPLDQYLTVDSSTDITLFAETMTEPHWPVCHNFLMSVLIETPNICSGPGSSTEEFIVNPSDQNTFTMRGIRRGECYFSVVFPEIDPNEIWEFSVPVAN